MENTNFHSAKAKRTIIFVISVPEADDEILLIS